jgi:hypothetical protein
MAFFLWQHRLSHMAHMCLSLSYRLLIAAHARQITSEVCRVSSGNPKSSMFFFRARSITETLQYYNSCTICNNLHQSNQRKTYNYKFTNHSLSCYNITLGTDPALLESTVPTLLRRSSLTDSQERVTRYSRHLSTPSARLSFPIKG